MPLSLATSSWQAEPAKGTWVWRMKGNIDPSFSKPRFLSHGAVWAAGLYMPKLWANFP